MDLVEIVVSLVVVGLVVVNFVVVGFIVVGLVVVGLVGGLVGISGFENRGENKDQSSKKREKASAVSPLNHQ